MPACAALFLAFVLTACGPKYNWRDYASPDASYRATFPAKPTTFTRDIDLDGTPVTMTMTAAEVDGATFAIGTAQAPDAARAQAALEAIRIALLRNIGAVDKTTQSTATSGQQMSMDVDATGQARGEPMRLAGHLEARGKRIYQVIVMGSPRAMPPEQIEQFLTSFKAH